jgi:NAD(P)-dependent dehydrogenase (short-subunit alcohol dehydrogenase family)
LNKKTKTPRGFDNAELAHYLASSDIKMDTKDMNRIILITGATRGIGRELAAQLAADGETVLLSGRDATAIKKVATEIGVNVHPIQLDASDQESVNAAAKKIGAEFGRVDVLVNNVGGIFDYAQKASTADLEVVQRALEINLFSTWRVTQAFIALLRKSPEPRIVNVSSESASLERMSGNTPAYSASKAALNALTRSLAGELADEGIIVHSASPGWTATDLGGEGGRPVRDGSASIKNIVNLPKASGTGGFYQDGATLPW